MKITFKMYASLAAYLPPEAERNIVEIDIPDDCSVHSIISRYNVPKESAHLILINGLYVEPDQRDQPIFTEGDVLAIWPPVAGG